MKKYSISIYFDNRNMATGSFQVKWSVYFAGKQKQFASGLVLIEKQVTFLKANKEILTNKIKNEDLRDLWHKIYGDGYIDGATGKHHISILNKGKLAASQIEEYFSFEIFARVLAGDFKPEGKESMSSDLIKAMEEHAVVLKSDGDISNGNLFISAANSLRRYAVYSKLSKSTETAKMPLQIVTAKYLRNYEKWMLQFGRAPKKKDGVEKPASITTVAIYTARIRVIFNHAKRAKLITEAEYPFLDLGYKIPQVLNTKKAQSEDVIHKIITYKCEPGSSREKWRDMWLFIYFGNGTNTMDICKLKNKNVNFETEEITFFRDKTVETKRDGMLRISIFIMPQIKDIIEKWRNPDQDPESNLFPFLPNNVTPEREKALVNQVTRNINQHMSRIAKELGIADNLTTYQARHSFASTLLMAEAPLAFISQALGHGSFKTTQRYLGSFEQKQTKKFLDFLIPKPPEKTEELIEQKPDQG